MVNWRIRAHNLSRVPALLRPVGGCALAVAIWLALATIGSAGPAEDEFEFFEKRIRPILVDSCHKCHAKGEKSKGGLQLDTREHLLKGGKHGSAITPDNPEGSLLLRAVRREADSDLKMPPDGEDKLSAAAVADLTAWVKQGAPWPPATAQKHRRSTGFDAAQKGFWAFQPVRKPGLPDVRDVAWSKNEIDLFILHLLEREGLKPAPPADKRTLIRRATFDLIGLPPTPAQIDDFLADDSPDAFARVVERLLASPHYGERWARHWLDLVRFSESDGHEFDITKPNAYHYRDYVIEAFNLDLPYDRFVREHFAGDLLSDPRVGFDGGAFVSPIATGFFYLGEVQNVPVDAERDKANQIENQVDVLGKAFLGMTLACARCHDHKFDPIPTEDYYALAGFLYSSEKIQSCVDTPERRQAIASHQAALEDCSGKISQLLEQARLESRIAAAGKLQHYLLAARTLLAVKADHRMAMVDDVAAKSGLDRETLRAWVDYLAKAVDERDPIFYAWSRLATVSGAEFPGRVADLGKRLAGKPNFEGEVPKHIVFAAFEQPTYEDWTAQGQAFGSGPTFTADPDIQGIRGRGVASSHRGTDALVGRLTSRKFTIEHKYLWFRLAGGEHPQTVRLSLLINDQALPEETKTGKNSDHLEQCFFDVHTLKGTEAALELVDEEAGPWGHLLVDDICFSNEPPPTVETTPNQGVAQLLLLPTVATPEALAEAIGRLFLEALAADPADPATPADQMAIRNWALRSDVPLALGVEPEQALSADPRQRLTELRTRQEELERDFPASTLALTATEGTPHDVRVQPSGAPDAEAPLAPRGFLSILADTLGPRDLSGSGRAQLADWVASPANPLTPRVLVNRVWQHHFGRGVVSTPDNFGTTGSGPSHPELLDYLASRFMEANWSIKSLHRLIMLSSAYQQASQTTREASRRDAENRLVHHWPMQRLEAECIRDAMLAVAGTLDPREFGPSVKLHLTPYMDGRDLPLVSGPLDGNARRSIYLEVRRNHLHPLLAAFDFPKPLLTVGSRQVSAVPAQALAMLNNEFVSGQAQAWARRVRAETAPDRERIQGMYLAALGRPADQEELAAALEFQRAQERDYARFCPNADERRFRAWADLCHVMFNLGEFIFVR